MNLDNTVKSRTRQLYSFLKEASQLVSPTVRAVSKQPAMLRLADVPLQESIQLCIPFSISGADGPPNPLMRLRRPVLTPCPAPTESVASWLLPGWEDPTESGNVAESRIIVVTDEGGGKGSPATEEFCDDETRFAEWAAWLEVRATWAAKEIQARTAMRVFETIYDIYIQLQRNGEQLELLAADGRLCWRTLSAKDGQVAIDHPILVKRVELRFDANIPEFALYDADRAPEIYEALFTDLQSVEPAAVRSHKEELAKAWHHPWGGKDTENFLRCFIQTVAPMTGEFIGQPVDTPSSQARLWRDQMLVLRRRESGVARAADAVLEDLEEREVPSAVVRIIGGAGDTGDGGNSSGPADAKWGAGIDDDDILLAKEVNDAQLQLIRRLEKSGSVIVQGPPGTGKTHTIGNLIGHLLAQGKSILVTAQTEKALKVLREKVPKPLQPLCVSMLGSDQDGRLQLESNIQSIEERRTTDTVGTLRARETDFKEKRRELRARLRDLEHQLQQCLEGEYREILVAGENMSPADAARRLASGREHHDWIPSPVLPGSELPLSSEELCRLYRLGTTFTAQEELDAMFVIPEPSTLPSVSAFRELVLEYTDLLTRDVSAASGWWSGNGGSSAVIQEIADILEAEFSSVLLKQVWAPYAIVAGMRGGVARNNWEWLIAAIERAVEANYRYEQVLHHQPQLADSIPVVDQQRQLVEINQYLTDGGTIGVFNLNAQWKWRRLLTSASVAAGPPCQKEHFEALGCLAELKSARLALEIRWNSLIGERAGMSFGSLSGTPELICSALVPEIRCCLNWSESVWGPLALKLKSVGLRLDELIHAQGHDWSEVEAFRVIEKLALKLIPQLLSDEFSRRRLSECRQAFASLENLSARQDPNAPHQGCIGPLAAAATARDVDGYREALSYVERLHAIAPTISDRKALLARLWPIAPVWAEKIWRREAPHDAGTVPGDVTAAWMWRQIEEMLSEREKANVEELQREIRETRDELRGVTLQLIEAKAWGAQLKRLQDQDSIRQALVGWVDTQKRLISTQKNAKRQELLSEGRRLMNRCSSAVPVWIMPIWRVVESFDLRTTRFDVVIIDEASQADFNALIPLYMGQQVVIVGDHEQVTPLGVGKDSSVLDNLRKSMLQGIPNSHLFDNLTSIYDIARQSFGTAIRLTEHFRCVPEIIAFSNQLSYEGKIEPLREANSTNLRPACIARRVHGIRENEVNHGEAENIVSTIQAMLQHPAYAGKSIGVISMKGSAQAALIDKMLRDGNRISESEYQNRRILTGDAKDFQGDERDVIFLSLVDGAKEDGLLYKMGDGAFEQIKKRYNVATSRARDQLWVVHSFDADQDLQASDIRAKLLRHVKDPQSTLRAFDREEARTESPFERAVLKRLASAGYTVRTQWRVGYFRIDMVVEGNGKRLAVECDGDRWHPIEQLASDMERQASLERRGWEFMRVRGTAFYRNPDAAMHPVFVRLGELGISPSTGELPDSPASVGLVEELDAIIAENALEQRLPESTTLAEVPHSSGKTIEATRRSHCVNDATEVTPGIVETVLMQYGGVAAVDTVLRGLTAATGRKRLGRNIRAGFEKDLKKLQKKGKLTLSGGVVQLL